MAAYLPPGWPTGVHPPGSADFERTAVAWLLDVVPPDYRLYGVLRRHPVALAAMARHHLAACVEGARQGYRTARTELGDVLPVHGLDAVLAAYRSEGTRLVATAEAADLVARALRGEVFTPRLRDSPGQNGRAAGPPEQRDGAADPPGQNGRAADPPEQRDGAADPPEQRDRAADPPGQRDRGPGPAARKERAARPADGQRKTTATRQRGRQK